MSTYFASGIEKGSAGNSESTTVVYFNTGNPKVDPSVGGATGAPATPDFIVGTSDAGLSAELVATDTTSIDFIKTPGNPGVAEWQREALTGDVTASKNSNVLTIANDAVTYAKIQNVTDARLLGRSAGSSGDVQEITVGTNLSLSSGSLAGVTHPMTNLFMYLTLRGGL